MISLAKGVSDEPAPGKQVEQEFRTGEKTVRYLLYLPKDYATNESKRPLLWFVHGRGESDGPLSLVKKWGPPRLIERGDLWAARRVLLSAGTLSTTYHSSGSRGYIWLRVRARLLNVERRLGHAREATEIEHELDQLLQVADADCRNTLQALVDQP